MIFNYALFAKAILFRLTFQAAYRTKPNERRFVWLCGARFKIMIHKCVRARQNFIILLQFGRIINVSVEISSPPTSTRFATKILIKRTFNLKFIAKFYCFCRCRNLRLKLKSQVSLQMSLNLFMISVDIWKKIFKLSCEFSKIYYISKSKLLQLYWQLP